jgi:flavin-dependent dehydrogenase
METQAGKARLVGSWRGSQQVFQARLVVLTTGANMGLLEGLGLLRRRPRYMLAARAYYEGVPAADDRVVFHFDGVPLPGYGWVFPLGDGRVNLGAGFFPGSLTARNQPANARQAFEAFIASPGVRPALAGARRVGPVKGYPLRVDFTTAPTYGPRLLLVGEAAGLVNPLTGEGIDNALESGVMAARFVSELFQRGDLGHAKLRRYDALLRKRFQRQFLICDWLRSLLVNPLLMDRVVRLAQRRASLRSGLLKIALGYPDALEYFSLRGFFSGLLLKPGW